MPFFEKAATYLPLLLQGVWLTIIVTITSLVLSTILGLFWAIIGQSKVAALRVISRTFIVVIRGLPIIVQLFYIYFVLPQMGINLTAFESAIIGLGVAYSAYQAENFRAGIEAVAQGQIEAAYSIGMKDGLVMRRVILPQAFRIALPAYGNIMIMMLKDSSLASTIAVTELTRKGQLIASSTFDNITVYTLVAILYLAMSLPLTYLTRKLEKRRKKR